MTFTNAPSPLLLVAIVVILCLLAAGGIMMLWSSRLAIIEEVRAWKLRTMHRPASIKGKTRTNKIG